MSVLHWMPAPNVHVLYPENEKEKVYQFINNELVWHIAKRAVFLAINWKRSRKAVLLILE